MSSPTDMQSHARQQQHTSLATCDCVIFHKHVIMTFRRFDLIFLATLILTKLHFDSANKCNLSNGIC